MNDASPQSTAIQLERELRPAKGRVSAVDVLRGFAMVLMPLDHTREFFTNFPGNPTDPRQTTIWLYLSRWITHLCAPVFVFLAGTSIYLQQQRKSKRELSLFLLSRGSWLIIVELTLVHFVFNFNWIWNVQILEVIWAIGASMVAMAGLIHFGVRANAVFGVLLIAGHNAFDAVMPTSFGRFGWLWSLLHVPGFLTGPPVKPPIILVAYPLLPWVGVMALGYAFGGIMMRGRERRIRFDIRSGVAMLTAFVALRSSNRYGDPSPWAKQANSLRTLFSFFNVQKYPPSLLFLLATLGIAALLIAAIEMAERRDMLSGPRNALQVFGRVPFFYFLVHLAIVHLLALTIWAATGGDWRWWITEFPKGGVLTGHPSGYGYGVGVIWSIWILVVVLCYPVCKWYAGVKRRSRHPLLSYL